MLYDRGSIAIPRLIIAFLGSPLICRVIIAFFLVSFDLQSNNYFFGSHLIRRVCTRGRHKLLRCMQLADGVKKREDRVFLLYLQAACTAIIYACPEYSA